MATAKRSTITGKLVLTFPKAKQQLEGKVKPKLKITSYTENTQKSQWKEGSNLIGTVDVRNIVTSGGSQQADKGKGKENAQQNDQGRRKDKLELDFDESEVPPLE